MKHRLRLATILLLSAMLVGPASAVTPDEVLDDPALEARAREISAELRCLVCQNQSIDESDAALAKDLRVIVRERLVDGASDREVIDYVVSRYGEFVLLKPRFTMRNLALWLTPALVFALGAAAGIAYVRRGRAGDHDPGTMLSAQEEARLAKILDDDDRSRG